MRGMLPARRGSSQGSVCICVCVCVCVRARHWEFSQVSRRVYSVCEVYIIQLTARPSVYASNRPATIDRWKFSPSCLMTPEADCYASRKVTFRTCTWSMCTTAHPHPQRNVYKNAIADLLTGKNLFQRKTRTKLCTIEQHDLIIT